MAEGALLRVVVAALCLVAAGADLSSRPPCPCGRKEQPSLAEAVRQSSNSYLRLVESLFQSQCDLVDNTRCSSPRNTRAEEEVDFIVVGSGSAGSVVACRLSEVPDWTVHLLEAGPATPTAASVPSFYHAYEGSAIDWNLRLEREDGYCLSDTCYWPRGKCVGGTSILHGMMYMRGHPWDYDRWAARGAKGWSWEDVLPYFLRSENNLDTSRNNGVTEREFHGTSGPMAVERFRWQPPVGDVVLEAARQMGERVGADLNGQSQLGFSYAQATTLHGARLNLLEAFCKGDPTARDNLHITTNAQVTRVLVDEESLRAVGVEFDHHGKLRRLFARKEVILSAGAINSPHILLLSGIGPRGHLKEIGIQPIHNLPGVGLNLQNHVSYKMRFRLDNWTPESLLNNATVQQYLQHREGPLTSTGMAQLTGFIRSRLISPELPENLPDLQIFFAGQQANESWTGSPSEEAVTYIDIVPTCLRPNSWGTIRLRSSDPLQQPIIRAGYLTHPDDVKLIIEGVRYVMELSTTPALRKLGATLTPELTRQCESHGFGTDEFWECSIRRYTGPENHQAGSCRMGTGSCDPTAVVDPHLRVIGIKGLRVVDASVMPFVPSGNLNAPVIMVAERGSQLIKDDWLDASTAV